MQIKLIPLQQGSFPEADVKVLAYWSEDGHIEDATFTFDSGVWHWLESGEVRDSEPTHWAPYPDTSQLSESI